MIIERREVPRDPKSKGVPKEPHWHFPDKSWEPEPDIKMVELCPLWVMAAFIFVATVLTVVFFGFLTRVTWG